MTARSALLPAALLLVVPCMAAPLHAQGVEYAAGTTKYRLLATTKGTQSSPMGSQDFQLDVRQQITVSLAKQSRDTIMQTVTLDSLSVKSAQGSPDVARLVGSKFVSYISPTGKLYRAEAAPGTDPLAAQITESVSRFLPTYRRDLKAGLTWSDTTSGKVTQQGIDLDRTMIANYKVLGDTTVRGDRALKLERIATVKAAGTGSAQGNPVALESATRSNGVFFLTPTGLYLGGKQDDDINVKITIVSQNAQINIKQAVQSTIEAIR
jgi:hypothetical protein